MKRSTMIELLVLLVIYLGFSGCIGHKAFPLAARTGDTISLALGGTRWHETGPGQEITLNDLDITIQQDQNGDSVIDANEIFDVNSRYLFRLYPDLTSNAANFGSFVNTPVGEWSVVLDLADSSGNPLPLSENQPATIVVTTSKLHNNFYGSSEGSLSNIPIDILSGIGESHHFNNDSPFSDPNMANLQPLPQLAISFSGSVNVAAAALEIDYDETVLNNSNYIKIIQNVSQPKVILNQRVYKDSSNNWKMRILLMTNQGTLQPGELKCFIIWKRAAIASGQTVTAGSFTVTSAKFYNESGAEVAGLGTNNVVTALLYQQQP